MSSKNKKSTNGHEHNKKEPAALASDEDEPIRAPVELKIEFVSSIMTRQWALAKQLCQYILMYEPNNNEAKQYAPLIDYMLAQQEEGSSSSSSDDSSDDDDDDDSGDSSSSSSSSSDEEENHENDLVESQAPDPVNASFSRQCTHHK